MPVGRAWTARKGAFETERTIVVPTYFLHWNTTVGAPTPSRNFRDVGQARLEIVGTLVAPKPELLVCTQSHIPRLDISVLAGVPIGGTGMTLKGAVHTVLTVLRRT